MEKIEVPSTTESAETKTGAKKSPSLRLDKRVIRTLSEADLGQAAGGGFTEICKPNCNLSLFRN